MDHGSYINASRGHNYTITLCGKDGTMENPATQPTGKAGGGGHGGAGEDGSCSGTVPGDGLGGQPGTNILTDFRFYCGSNGGANYNGVVNGDGGGAIAIKAYNVTINGTLSTGGGTSNTAGVGGGSGGDISINASHFELLFPIVYQQGDEHNFDVIGGNAGGGAGGGGGGVIRIFYGTIANTTSHINIKGSNNGACIADNGLISYISQQNWSSSFYPKT